MSARSPSASTRSPCLEKCRNSLCDVGTVGGYTGRSRDTSRTGFRHRAGLLLRFRLHGDFRLFDAGFLFRALRNLFLCAALGLFALLFQSLHFLLAFLERNGHKNLLKFALQSVTAVNPPRTLPAGFPRLAGGFFGTCFVNFQIPAANLLAIQSCNGLGSFLVVWHLHEGKSPRATGFAILHQVKAAHLSERLEQIV